METVLYRLNCMFQITKTHRGNTPYFNLQRPRRWIHFIFMPIYDIYMYICISTKYIEWVHNKWDDGIFSSAMVHGGSNSNEIFRISLPCKVTAKWQQCVYYSWNLPVYKSRKLITGLYMKVTVKWVDDLTAYCLWGIHLGYMIYRPRRPPPTQQLPLRHGHDITR